MKITASSALTLEEQVFEHKGYYWSVARLVTLSKDLPVFKVPLSHLDMSDTVEEGTLRQFVGQMQAVLDSDLSYPIILDEDGSIMDGRHRLMKAIHLGKETIKVVRFEINPQPCGTVPCEN